MQTTVGRLSSDTPSKEASCGAPDSFVANHESNHDQLLLFVLVFTGYCCGLFRAQPSKHNYIFSLALALNVALDNGVLFQSRLLVYHLIDRSTNSICVKHNVCANTSD